jgi:hypothetical protein
MQWILIIAFYAGAVSNSDSVSLASVPGFINQQECMAAGNQVKSFGTIHKAVSFVCAKQSQ